MSYCEEVSGIAVEQRGEIVQRYETELKLESAEEPTSLGHPSICLNASSQPATPERVQSNHKDF